MDALINEFFCQQSIPASARPAGASVIGLIRSHNKEVLDRLLLNYLFFDRLLVVGANSIWPHGLFSHPSPLAGTDEEHNFREFEWCAAQGVFEDAEGEPVVSARLKELPEVRLLNEWYLREPGDERGHIYQHFVERIYAQILSEHQTGRLCSTLPPPETLPTEAVNAVTVADAYQIAIREIVVPARNAPWDEIIALKADRDFLNRRNHLLRHCAELASLSLTPQDIVESVREGIHEYNEYMARVRAVRSGTLIVAFTETAEVVEDILKFRLGKLSRRVLDAGARRLEFAEKELQSPGRQVSALVRAGELLSR